MVSGRSTALKVWTSTGLAVLEDREVPGGQAAHRLAVPIEHRDVERDELDAGPELRRRLGLLRAGHRAAHRQRQDDDGEEAQRLAGHSRGWPQSMTNVRRREAFAPLSPASSGT